MFWCDSCAFFMLSFHVFALYVASSRRVDVHRVDFIQLMVNAQTPDDSKDNPNSTGRLNEGSLPQYLNFIQGWPAFVLNTQRAIIQKKKKSFGVIIFQMS